MQLARLLICSAVALGLATTTATAKPNDDSHMGFANVELATASAPADTVLYDFGLAVGFYAPSLDASVSFGGASAPLLTGDRRAFNTTPAVGYHVGWRNAEGGIIQLYGAARVPLQIRTGAGLSSETGIGVAAEAGVRLWACSREDRQLRGLCMGINVGTRYQVNLSELQMGPAVLPAGSSVWSFPISIGFAINPDIR